MSAALHAAEYLACFRTDIMLKACLLDHEPYVGIAGEVHGHLDVPHRCCLDNKRGEAVECANVLGVGRWKTGGAFDPWRTD